MPEPQKKIENIESLENKKPQEKRFCVTWMRRERVEKPKATGREHSYFTAIDQADAENQFWDERLWKPPIKKVEIISIEPV